MNGQMYQIACIVAVARKALKSGKEIWYNPEKYTNKLSFQILPSEKGKLQNFLYLIGLKILRKKV